MTNKSAWLQIEDAEKDLVLVSAKTTKVFISCKNRKTCLYRNYSSSEGKGL